jgi:hypothetical protein
MMYKSQGNWAEDLGHDISVFMKLGIAAIFVVPALMIVIAILIVLLVT